MWPEDDAKNARVPTAKNCLMRKSPCSTSADLADFTQVCQTFLHQQLPRFLFFLFEASQQPCCRLFVRPVLGCIR